MKDFLGRLVLLVAVGIWHAGHAVTLGEAHVHSYLNQPLDVEIELLGVGPGQHEDLRLRIANQDQFDRLGIVYDRVVNLIRFQVVKSDNRWMVRARTDRPITEPFLEFPLQMNWPGGQLIRQYTLLFDPVNRIRSARTSRAPRPAAALPPASATPREPIPDVTGATDSYGPVQRGETLWPIAQKVKPQGITTRQMAMALLRANPQAFIDGDINRLKAGAVLNIPARTLIEELDAAAARRAFAEAAQGSRRTLPAVATSPRDTEGVAATARSPGQSTAEPPAPAAESEDPQLRIVSPGDETEKPSDNEQALKDKLLVTMEEIESNRLTTGAIEARLARLESELDRMQRLIDLKDAQIATLQSELDARNAAAPVTEAPVPAGEPPAPATSDRPQQRTATAVAEAQPAPVTITKIEPIINRPSTGNGRAWYEQNLWLIWVALAVLGLLVLLLLFRRTHSAHDDIPMAELPEIRDSGPPPYAAASTPRAADLRRAEDDFRSLQPSPPPPEEVELAPLPELEPIARQAAYDADEDAITESLLNETLGVHENPQQAATEPPPGAEFDDDDIASWIKELSTDANRNDARSANDEQLPGSAEEQLPSDEDIPSILTELDDQLASSKPEGITPSTDVEMEPLDEEYEEDDTFTMSLDLARAYLEIGDQEGARDMLKQALSGAHDPEHRRQIEELLQQID